MGLVDELNYRRLIKLRRKRWEMICVESTRLLDENFRVSHNNPLLLSVVSAFYGVKTSPRGSFDRFLLRELNTLEIPYQNISENKVYFDIHSEISNVLNHLLTNTDIKIDTCKNHSTSLELNKNLLFLEVIHQLPTPIPIDNPYANSELYGKNAEIVDLANLRNLRHFQIYTFSIGLFTLTSAASFLDLKTLKKIIHIVYYFAQTNACPRDWLKRQLEINYSDQLKSYKDDVIFKNYAINITICNKLKGFKEILIEICQPLVCMIYHNKFARNWHFITNDLDFDRDLAGEYEFFYQLTGENIQIGLVGYDLTHEISIGNFSKFYNLFIPSKSIELQDCTFKADCDYALNFLSNISEMNPIFNDCDVNLLHKFISHLWLLLTRYESIGESCSKNLQSSVPQRVSEFANDVLGADIECFASPLNVQLRHFCSLFQIDTAFGSKGNFFECAKNGLFDQHVSVVVNPPFENGILEKTVDVILQLLGGSWPLCVLFVGPLWNCDFYSRLSSCGYNKCLIKLESGCYKYRNTQGYEYKPVHESFCSILYNEHALLGRQLSQSEIDLLIKCWSE